MIDDSLLAIADIQIESFNNFTPARRAEHKEAIRGLAPAYQELATEWLTTGVAPSTNLKGMTLERIIRMMRAHPLEAIIILDQLAKDPDAHRPVIQLYENKFRFNVRSEPPGFTPMRPAASSLTEALAESASDYFHGERVDPPELRLPEASTATLGTVVSGLASAADTGELAEEVQDLRRIIDLVGEIPDEPDGPLNELQRIGLVLRLLADLAADDLRKMRAGAQGTS
jgi:hypothetical protein